MHRLFLTAVLILLTIGNAQARDTLRIAIEGAFPPFSFVTNEGLAGFDVDIAREVCSRLKKECDLRQHKWDGLIPGLEAKKFDAIVASMSVTPSRKKLVDFSKPYWFTPSRFVAKKGRFKSDSPQVLAEKRIGVQRGSIQDDYISALYPQSDIRRYENQQEVFLDLMNGRLDAIIGAEVAMAEGFLKTEDGKDFGFFGKDHTDETFFGIGAGIAVRKGDPIVDALNRALDSIIEDGTYYRIASQYFSVDIAPK